MRALAAALLALVAPASVASGEPESLVVTATAYNSLPGQTDRHPDLGAWGDRLEPGMMVIAVSRDLIALGLTRGALVSIEGLPGQYRVLDKMARHWKRRIDIYMGRNRDAALDWGRQRVRIRWHREP